MSDSRNAGVARGIDDDGSIVSGAPGRQLSAVRKVALASLVLVVFLGFIWINQLTKATQPVKQPDVTSLSAGGAFHPPPGQPDTPAATPTSLPMPATSTTASILPPARHEMTPAESPIFAFAGGGGVPGTAEAASPAQAALSTGATAGPPAGAPSALTSMLKPTVLSGSKARLLPHPDMMLTMGTMIPCTLQTAIDSQLAGYVKCVLPQDVRSTTGDVVLLDRGTSVVGEIGRSGLPGRVNNHWWERFGSAILLSVIQGGLQTGTALAANSGSSGGTFFNSFQSNGTNISDTALQATINIPPTLEKNQGDNVAIFVAKDLDFSDVYNLRVTGTGRGQ
jgi:type IV secretion system protein VirB10